MRDSPGALACGALVVALLAGASLNGCGSEIPFEERRGDRTEPMREVEALVDSLGDPAFDLGRKREAARRIAGRGADAIPVLIAHLGDARVFEKGRDVQNYYGLPPHLPPPAPVYADIEVSSVCRDLLYEIVTPRYRSPHERVMKPISTSMLRVHDWAAFWEKRKHRTLAEIHAELEPYVDRYWREGGVEQTVP